MVASATFNMIFLALFLSSTDNADYMSTDAERRKFVRSLTINKIILRDAIQPQSLPQKTITSSLAENCIFNLSSKCFSTLSKKNSSLEVYNVTKESRKQNLIVERENLRRFGKLLNLKKVKPFFLR